MRTLEKRLQELEDQTSRLASAINELQARIDSIQKNSISTSNITPLSSRALNVMTSPVINNENLMIPEAMARTVNVLLQKRGQLVTSEDVSKATGRSKHLESSYLCRLFERGFLNRKRIGRKVYYSVAGTITWEG